MPGAVFRIIPSFSTFTVQPLVVTVDIREWTNHAGPIGQIKVEHHILSHTFKEIKMAFEEINTDQLSDEEFEALAAEVLAKKNTRDTNKQFRQEFEALLAKFAFTGEKAEALLFPKQLPPARVGKNFAHTHPTHQGANANEIYRGKGKVPEWLRVQIEAGKDMDDFLTPYGREWKAGAKARRREQARASAARAKALGK